MNVWTTLNKHLSQVSHEEPGSPKTRSLIWQQSLELERRSKADPAAVARSMMCAKDSTGNVLFKSNEFLTANQIAGFFFLRLASKKTLVDDEQQGDIKVVTLEAGLDVAVRERTPKQPIVYDAYNLCELASQKKISDFSIAVLKEIGIFLTLTFQM